MGQLQLPIMRFEALGAVIVRTGPSRPFGADGTAHEVGFPVAVIADGIADRDGVAAWIARALNAADNREVTQNSRRRSRKGGRNAI